MKKEIVFALFFLAIVVAGFISVTLSLTRGFANSVSAVEMRYSDGEDYGK